MVRYVWKDGDFVDPSTGKAMELPYKGKIAMPYVQGDISAYASPITGEMIEGRRARREDLKKHNCIEAGDKAPLNGGRVRNEKFARKHGLKWAGD